MKKAVDDVKHFAPEVAPSQADAAPKPGVNDYAGDEKPAHARDSPIRGVPSSLTFSLDYCLNLTYLIFYT